MASLFKFKTENIKGDLFGGVTAGIVALPLALAFGVQSGLGATAGLYGAIALGIVAAIFGGTACQISGPTGPMTVVSTVVVMQAIDTYGSIESGLGFIVLIFMLSGVFQIIFGLLKLGTYIEYIPYPVVSGFMTGIGVIIIILSIFPFVGLDSPKTVIDVVKNLDVVFSTFNSEAGFVATATIGIIYLFPQITRSVPSALVALILLSVVAYWADLNIPVIGEIPAGLPEIKISAIAGLTLENLNINLLVELALTLAILGAIDSLLTSVIADNVTKTRHDSNRELIGQGLGNIVAGSIGGLPGAGATMRTLVNVNSGGKYRISGVVHGALLLTILLGLGAYAQHIPRAVLAGILITVGIGIIDYKGLRHLPHVPKADKWVMILVLLMTVFIDLIQAVAAGLILSSILFMKKMSDDLIQEVKIAPLKDYVHDIPWQNAQIPDHIIDKIYVKQLEGPFFFGFASAFQKMAKTLPDVKAVVFRMKKVPHIDQTGLYALEEVIMDLEKKGIVVVMAGLQPQPLRMLKRINLIPGLIPEHYTFERFNECILWLESQLKLSEGDETRFFDELGNKELHMPLKYTL